MTLFTYSSVRYVGGLGQFGHRELFLGLEENSSAKIDIVTYFIFNECVFLFQLRDVGSSFWFFLIFLLIDFRERKGGRERNNALLFHWFMYSFVASCMCLTGDRTSNVGLSGQCSKDLSYLTRAILTLNKSIVLRISAPWWVGVSQKHLLSKGDSYCPRQCSLEGFP